MADPGYMDRGTIPSCPECGRWETLLADALDGQLRPEDEAAFTGHMATCPGCAALFEEARRGREWLEFLSAEPEIPEGLLDRILAQTGPGQVAGYGLVTDSSAAATAPHPWQRPGLAVPGFANHMRRHAQARLLMTMAMAFFSIALTLNLVGFRFSEVRLSDLRPSAVRSLLTRRIVTASIPILRYYDHLRFLYQVESSMQQGAPAEGQSESAPMPAMPGGAGASMPDPGKGPGKNPRAGGKNEGLHRGSPVHSGTHEVYPGGEAGYFLVASLKVKDGLKTPASTGRRWTRQAHSSGSPLQRQAVGAPATRARERSGLWTA